MYCHRHDKTVVITSPKSVKVNDLLCYYRSIVSGSQGRTVIKQTSTLCESFFLAYRTFPLLSIALKIVIESVIDLFVPVA